MTGTACIYKKPISIQLGLTYLYVLTFLVLNLQGVSEMLEQTSRMSSWQQSTEENSYKCLSGNEYFLSSVDR